MNTMTTLPRCLFELRSQEAQREYDVIVNALVGAGRLTMESQRALSSYALQVDAVIQTVSAGKPVRASRFTQLDRARAKLKLDELEPAAAGAGPPRSKFAKWGFSNRIG